MLTSTPKLSQGAKFAARSVDQPHRLERVFMLVASVALAMFGIDW